MKQICVPLFQHIRLGLILSVLALPILAPPLQAQEKVLLVNPDAAPKEGEPKLEIEVVEIGRFGASPDVIKRPAGKFILLIINRSDQPDASFALEPAKTEQLSRRAPPSFARKELWKRNQRAAGVIDTAAGELHLKSVTTGKTLCTITIE